VASGRLRQRGGQGESRWWVGALAALGVCAVVLGIVLVAVTISRRRDDVPSSAANPADPAGTSAAAVNPGAGDAAPKGPASAMPHGKLLNDDERFRSLLAQVHGRGGKESPELRALLDEQASIAAQALQPGCVGAHCSALKEIGKIVTDTTKKRVKRRSQAPATMRSRWLAGLEMPEIPVEDDPRVQKRFEFYTENPLGRETFQQMLFRCGAYKDMIQSSLIRRGLPKDLIAVAYAESGCYPLAKSPMGAEGLWQFIPDAARAYHLRIIEGVVDERHSPQKSTEAAIQYYSDMYAKFGEWDLAFASYNMGPFGLAARIERVEGEKVGFWELVDAGMLPDETADYAPGIQAIALILNNLQKLKFGAIQQRAPQMTMDLPVPPNTRMSLVARAAATSLDELRRLNLDIKGTSTPNVPNFAVQVAKDSVWQARDTLQALLQSKDDGDMCVPQNFDWGRQRFTPEMQEACTRSLGARAASSSAPLQPPPCPARDEWRSLPRRQRPPIDQERAGRSDRDVFLQVPAREDGWQALTRVVLRRVGDLDLGVVDLHLFLDLIGLGLTAEAEARDDQLFEVDDDVLERARLAARFANVQVCAGDVLAIAAELVENRRRLVDELADDDVAVLDAAGGEARAGTGSALLRHVPRPAQDLNLVGVLGVFRLALNPFDA
jgi:hypothetical protein